MKVVDEFKKINPNVPTDPEEQLRGAILAVFRSWNNDRAIRYRSYNGIPDKWGTAVSVQAMAYGNMNDDCGTGVAFSRNPSTGENKFFGGEREEGRREEECGGRGNGGGVGAGCLYYVIGWFIKVDLIDMMAFWLIVGVRQRSIDQLRGDEIKRGGGGNWSIHSRFVDIFHLVLFVCLFLVDCGGKTALYLEYCVIGRLRCFSTLLL